MFGNFSTGSRVANSCSNSVIHKILGKTQDDDDICAQDIMFSRNDVEFVRLSYSLDEIVEIFKNYKDNYLPVIEYNEYNEIIGVISLNDILKCVNNPKDSWLSYIQKVAFLSENSNINNVLFQLHSWPLVVVIDEFGQAIGIITKQIFSDTIIEKVYLSNQSNSKEIILQGDMYIDELKNIINLDKYNSFNADTVSAFVICLFDRIPGVGDKIFIGDYEIIVLESDRKYVKSIKINKKYLQIQ